MNIAEGFIRRPVMTTLVMLAILLFGIMGYRQLPVSDLPNVDFPTLLVSASLPGATPDTMASAVAQPLERQFSTIAGLDSMTSTSSQGSTQITLLFNLSRNIDAAAQDVQAMIAKAARDLPQNMPSPPSYQKVNPADQPVIYMSLNSPTLRLSDVDEYAETLIAQRVSMVSGVAQVQVMGAQKYSVRVSLDPKALASRQVGIDEVAQAIQSGNVNMPTGTLFGANQAFIVQATGQLNKAADYEPLIVTYRNGAPVRLGDVGTVRDSVENDKTASWYFDNDGGVRRAIMLAIQRQPGTNTVEVVDNIKQLLPSFREQMPPSVKLNILYDRSVSIRDSVSDVKFTLMLALVLVVLVIFLFLRNVSATAIPSLALPLSLVGTFGVMYLMGYSLDNLSLMALTLCVGFVVDDAIVVLENIVRHMEMGEEPMQAALRGSSEIGFTIVSMTLSLAAVFIPVLFMSGLVGRLLHEFAVTIGAAILVSGFVSLSLTPMLCSRFLRPHKKTEHGRLWRITEKFFDGLLRFYDRTLQFTLRHRRATLVVSLLVLAGTVQLFRTVPTGFLPDEDQGFLFVFTEGPQGISYDSMVRHQKQLNDIVMTLPWVDSFNSTVGGGSSNQGRIFIHMLPRGQRKPALQLVQELRARLMAVPGINAYPQMLPTIRIGGQLTKSQYQFTLQSPDTKELYDASPRLESKLKTDPRVRNLLQDVKRPADQESADRRQNQSGSGLVSRHIGPAGGRRPLYGLWCAPGLDHLRAVEHLSRDHGVAARVPGRPTGALHAVRAIFWRTTGAAQCGGAVHAQFGSADHQPPGPVAGGDAIVQPAPRCGPGRRRQRRQPGCPRHLAAGRFDQLPGNRASISVVAERVGRAADHGDCGDLPGAGDSVRELHPPADHSLGIAFGRLRSAAHADDLQD